MTFENMIARVRKIQEHVDEMQEIIDTLKGEKESLEASILVALDNNPELYNVYVRKNASAGIVGRNMFKVTFSTTLARLGELDRLDDQEWLATLDENYTKSKLSLRASAIRSAYSAGEITDGALRSMRLRYVNKASLDISHIPDESEINDLTESAEQLAESGR